LKTCNKNLACDSLTKSVSLNIPVSAFADINKLFNIYPNPAKTKIHITGLNSSYDATIFDIAGKKQIELKQSRTNVISIANLKQGLYFIKIEAKEGVVVRKFIKQ